MALSPQRGNGGSVGIKYRADVGKVIIPHDHPPASPTPRLPHIWPHILPGVPGIIMLNRGVGWGGDEWMVVKLHSKSVSDSPESGGAERESGVQSQALTG